MEIGVDDQLRQLTAALITGGIIGLLYDAAGAAADRKNTLSKAWKLIMFLLCAAAVFAVGRASGAGTRLFFLMAVLGGVCLYLWALHPLVSGKISAAKHFFQNNVYIKQKNASEEEDPKEKNQENSRK